MPRISALALALSILALVPATGRAQSTADQVGLTALADRLGAANVPTGANVEVGQVEASAPGYAPDVHHPEFAGKTFSLLSGGGTPSGHATTVGQFFYGLSTSIAPGITLIDCWSALNWLGGGFLNGTGSTPPDPVTLKIFNHSWIGSGSFAYLRKLDFAVEDQGLIVVDGVNNGPGRLDVTLLSHAFNCIAVGRSDGQHHAGDTLTGTDGGGRMKPELVAPAGATSFSTPLVAGAAALLVETARTDPALSLDPDAERPEVVRAALMAGAEHRAGWTNGAVPSGPARGTTLTPLDALYGADEIDVNHSHWILTGGAQSAAVSAATALLTEHSGWSLTDIGSGESRWWRFQVDSAKPNVSVIAAWNRQVALDFQSWSRPDVDLELWRLDATGAPQTLVGDPGLASFASGNVQSSSSIDNVEHLFLTDLQPGDYALELRRGADALASWQVAVAWELGCRGALSYGTGKVNSLGLIAQLTAHGFANVGADQLDLRVADALPNKSGLVFWGTASASIPFMGGTLLVQPPIVRLPPVTLDANGAVTIPLALDSTMIGQRRYFQFWYRDPNDPTGFTIGLSDAVDVQFCY